MSETERLQTTPLSRRVRSVKDRDPSLSYHATAFPWVTSSGSASAALGRRGFDEGTSSGPSSAQMQPLLPVKSTRSMVEVGLRGTSSGPWSSSMALLQSWRTGMNAKGGCPSRP